MHEGKKMNKIQVTKRDGDTAVIAATPGISIMETIRSAGIPDIAALCGGTCSCATCHVYVDDAWFAKVGVPGDDEDDLLSLSADRQANSRLSCQIPFSPALDGIAVTIAPES
jgi:2Fe-2S ferredoxin